MEEVSAPSVTSQRSDLQCFSVLAQTWWEVERAKGTAAFCLHFFVEFSDELDTFGWATVTWNEPCTLIFIVLILYTSWWSDSWPVSDCKSRDCQRPLISSDEFHNLQPAWLREPALVASTQASADHYHHPGPTTLSLTATSRAAYQ